MAKKRTKFIRNLIRKLGYDLRRLETVIVHAEDPESTLGQEYGLDAYEALLPRNVERLDILFRSCSGVEIFGQERKRLLSAPKSEVIVRCLNSLVKSIAHAVKNGVDIPITLTVFDDHSESACVEKMKKILMTSPIETNFIDLEVKGNGPSVGAAYRHARDHFKDLIYFVEDDYLHEIQAVLEFVRSYERLAGTLDKELILHPADRTGAYRHIRPAQVYLGSHRHWRSSDETTFTMVTSREILEKYWDWFIGLEKYGIDPKVTEATTIFPIFREVPCLMPIPSLTVHFQQFDEISPLVDWRSWWEQAGEGLAETD